MKMRGSVESDLAARVYSSGFVTNLDRVGSGSPVIRILTDALRAR